LAERSGCGKRIWRRLNIREVLQYSWGNLLMNSIKKATLTGALTAFLLAVQPVQPVQAADPATGTWKTESNDDGNYLLVNIAPCKERLCGTIVGALNKDNESDPEHRWLGKQMIINMKPASAGKYKKGKIWAPDEDKTYKAKMEIIGESLKVSGCVAIFCRDQTWIRSKL